MNQRERIERAKDHVSWVYLNSSDITEREHSLEFALGVAANLTIPAYKTELRAWVDSMTAIIDKPAERIKSLRW